MSTPNPVSNPAITLRDLFACHIIGAMIVAPKQPGVVRLELEGMCQSAYEYADAMLKARG